MHQLVLWSREDTMDPTFTFYCFRDRCVATLIEQRTPTELLGARMRWIQPTHTHTRIITYIRVCAVMKKPLMMVRHYALRNAHEYTTASRELQKQLQLLEMRLIKEDAQRGVIS